MGILDMFKKKNLKEENKNEMNKEDKTYNVVETYTVKFPFFIDIEKEDCEDVELSGNKAYEYLIKDEIEGICLSFENCEIHKYFDKIGEKIVKMKMQFLEDGYIKVSILVREKFLDDEKQKLLEFITGQMSDGWGEGDFDFENNNGEWYSIRFWKDKNWNIDFI